MISVFKLLELFSDPVETGLDELLVPFVFVEFALPAELEADTEAPVVLVVELPLTVPLASLLVKNYKFLTSPSVFNPLYLSASIISSINSSLYFNCTFMN